MLKIGDKNFPVYSSLSLNGSFKSQMRLKTVINWFDIVPVPGTKMRAEKQGEQRFLRFTFFIIAS
jgi:hypothetical protein